MMPLVIDDEERVAGGRQSAVEVCVRGLEGEADQEVALEKVPRDHYDFLLIDHRMPGRDGEWFMKHVDLGKRTKALLLTGCMGGRCESHARYGCFRLSHEAN